VHKKTQSTGQKISKIIADSESVGVPDPVCDAADISDFSGADPPTVLRNTVESAKRLCEIWQAEGLLPDELAALEQRLLPTNWPQVIIDNGVDQFDETSRRIWLVGCGLANAIESLQSSNTSQSQTQENFVPYSASIEAIVAALHAVIRRCGHSGAAENRYASLKDLSTDLDNVLKGDSERRPDKPAARTGVANASYIRAALWLLLGCILIGLTLPKQLENSIPYAWSMWPNIHPGRFSDGARKFVQQDWLFRPPTPARSLKKTQVGQEMARAARLVEQNRQIRQIRSRKQHVLFEVAHFMLPAELLSNARAAKANLDGADLRYMDLTGANFENMKLDNVLFDYSNLSGASFVDSRLVNCSFAACTSDVGKPLNLANTESKNCIFYRCQLPRTNLKESRFDECRFSAIEFDQECNGKLATFNTCNLKFVSFEHSYLYKAAFLNCKLSNVSFTSAQMSDSDFSDSSLFRCDFFNTTLKNAKHVRTTVVSCRRQEWIIDKNLRYKGRQATPTINNAEIPDSDMSSWPHQPGAWVSGFNNGMPPQGGKWLTDGAYSNWSPHQN
jgi:uncharacterized protein YjbI with pentapeptide repeats